MIEKIIYMAIGFILGLYTGNKEFRTKINNILRPIWRLLTRLEFRNNHRNNRKGRNQRKEIDYENYYNPGSYCVLPSHQMRVCRFSGYCGNCPVYQRYKKYKQNPDQNNQPVGFDEGYWWGDKK